MISGASRFHRSLVTSPEDEVINVTEWKYSKDATDPTKANLAHQERTVTMLGRSSRVASCGADRTDRILTTGAWFLADVFFQRDLPGFGGVPWSELEPSIWYRRLTEF